jgi:uncharacterized protein with HEPN domain
MSKELDRLKVILAKIDAIFEIVKTVSITTALDDNILRRPAILMHLVAIAEQFHKLHKFNSKFLISFDNDDLRGSLDIRNFIAHDYEGVNLAIIEMVIRDRLPIIATTIKKIIRDCVNDGL